MKKITIPQIDTYYLIGSRPMNRLVWINRMGKLYCYNVEDQEFQVDDIGEWKYYERIVLESSPNPSHLIKVISKKHQVYQIKKTFALIQDLLWLTLVYPLKKIFRLLIFKK